MVKLKQLISHRFRGFAPYENTLEGLTAALDFGVFLLEFDVRAARCGTPMIYHDEHAADKNGNSHHLCDVMARDFETLGGTFSRISTADELFKIAAAHQNTQAKLLIDIKDAGFETEIHALVMQYGLGDRAVYVSWLPEVLYAMHDLAPDADYCLSHWCQEPDPISRSLHRVFTSKTGDILRPNRSLVHGERSGWWVKKPLKGELRDIVTSVCVPQYMVTRDLVENYHADNIAVSTFSYLTWDHINQHDKDFNIDLYFIDNKDVFEQL